MDMYFKTVLVFIHFSLAAYCLVSIIAIDRKILKAYGTPVTEKLFSEMADVKVAIKHALFWLWVTGSIIVAYGTYTSPGYLANPKLWFKLFVVGVLTVNGIFVHRFSRFLMPGMVLADVNAGLALRLHLVGVVSSVSWFWACFLGTARAWNGSLPFTTIMAFYLLSLSVGLAVAVFVCNRQKRLGWG